MTGDLPPAELIGHAGFVRRLARALARDASTADDLAQETWRTALARVEAARGGRPWLARVVRNLARRRWRGESRRSARERRVAREEAQPATDAVLARQELLEAVVDALRRLEEPYRATILARFYEGQPPRVIARRDGVPVETVRTRIKRGLARLRGELSRHEEDWVGALLLLGSVRRAGPPVVLAPVTIGAVVLLGAGTWWGLSGRAHPGEVVSAGLARPSSSASPAGAAPERGTVPRREVPLGAVGARLAGRVVDESGAPVAGAPVLVLGDEDPFGPDGTDIAWNHWQGRVFHTDANGAWSAVLPGPARVLVTVEGTAALSSLEPERWVEVPLEGLELRVRVHPVGVLSVRALDEMLAPLEAFRVRVCGAGDPRPAPGEPATYTGGFHTRSVTDGVLELELRVDGPGAQDVRVTLVEPGPELEQEAHLLPGARTEVVFVLPARGRVAGFVLDSAGQPVADALVFFGPETRVRGDEPFQPLRLERVLDGVRTQADGRFSLPGDGSELTVVHEDHSGVTVDARSTGRIVLGARGAIEGTVLDESGQPLADVVVQLDRTRETRTTAGGAFRFESVEAGAHGLRRDGRGAWTGVRLAPGEVRSVRLGGRALPTLELQWLDAHGRSVTFDEEVEGLVVGLDPVFAVAPLAFDAEGRVHVSPGLPPGRYWATTRSDSGASGGEFEVLGSDGVVRVEVSAELVVRSARATRVQVVPEDSDPFLCLAAARLGQPARPGAPARFRLGPGRYVVVGEAGVVLAHVVLPAEGFALDLDR